MRAIRELACSATQLPNFTNILSAANSPQPIRSAIPDVTGSRIFGHATWSESHLQRPVATAATSSDTKISCYHRPVTSRARQLLRDAMSLPEDERLELAEQSGRAYPPTPNGFSNSNDARAAHCRIPMVGRSGMSSSAVCSEAWVSGFALMRKRNPRSPTQSATTSMNGTLLKMHSPLPSHNSTARSILPSPLKSPLVIDDGRDPAG